MRRAEALAAIMRSKRGIVIAGMHGKTTTSAMTAHVLREGGLHPSHYVGAEIPILGTQRALGSARRIFCCRRRRKRRDRSRCFHPEHALILNIEEEHLDFYADLDAIEKVFAQLIAQTTGKVFYNADDANARRDYVRSARAESPTVFPRRPIIAAADIELQDFASVFLRLSPGTRSGRSSA